MKKIKYIYTLILLAFVLAGCDDYLDVNVNPDKPTAVPADQVMPVAMFYAAQTNYDHAEYGVYLSQCLTTTGKNAASGLAYQAGWHFLAVNRHPQWRRHYFDIGKNLYEMNDVAEKNNQYDYLALSRTILLMSTLLTTDVFGDMPRTEVYLSNTPRYDTQESIYEWMKEEANDLLAYYDSPEVNNVSEKITSKQDRVFGGDMKKWKQVVYALKARILLRNLPSMNNTTAICDEIIATVDAALAGWNEPLYKYDGGIMEKNCPWGESRPIINSWESRQNNLVSSVPSKFFMEQILKYADGDEVEGLDWLEVEELPYDPRLPYLMDARPYSGVYAYRYLENNYGKPASLEQVNYPNLYSSVLTQNDGAISLFTTAELYFIKAEAAYWKRDKSTSLAALKDGITANMKALEVPQSIIDRYLESDFVPGTSNLDLEYIMREKYIAMYLQPEQWNDMRRYNYSNNEQKKFGVAGEEVIVYPTLRRPYNLYSAYWDVTQTNEWVQRLNYDRETEPQYNLAELIRLGAWTETDENPDWLRKPMIWSPLYTK